MAIMMQKSGQTKKAIELFERVISRTEAIFGKDHALSILAQENLAVCYSSIKSYRNAMLSQRIVYAFQKARFGEVILSFIFFIYYIFRRINVF